MGTNHPEERFWPKFCELTGKPEFVNDSRYADVDSRIANAPELVPVFDVIFQTRTRDEWMKLFRDNGFMFAPVQGIEEVLHDPQALENNYVVDFDHPTLGPIKLPGFPVRFSTNHVGTKSPSPRLGEHTDIVLRDIGYSTGEIDHFRKNSIIR